jgi:peptidoglycan hydrolase-like protein with peptidoglycan-binding domain
MAYDFINAQVRSILNGLGFKSRNFNEPDFPLSADDSPLDDQETVQAIVAFQKYFNLAQDGIMGSQTKAVAERALNVIHYELDVVIQPDPLLRPQVPLYGPQTAQAVSKFRRQFGFEPDGNVDNDRIASLPVRRKLNDLTSQQTGEMATSLV